MKISKLFHWLYAAIMFLPLVVLPVFAIYSHRHTLTEQQTVDIQYKYESNEVNTANDLVDNNVYFLNSLNIQNLNTSGEEQFNLYLLSYDSVDLNDLDFISNNDDVSLNSYNANDGNFLNIYINQDIISFYIINENSFSSYVFDGVNINIFFYNVNFYFVDDSNDVDGFVSYLSTINHTLPSFSDFNVIESVTVEDTNSDIMSVCINQFNNSINKYFNMRRVFNLNDLYTWLNTNVFNNANSIGFNICFNLFAYWLFVSLLWLLFDAFMYIPLIMHNAIDKARLE